MLPVTIQLLRARESRVKGFASRHGESVLGRTRGGGTYIGVANDHVIESFRNRLWPNRVKSFASRGLGALSCRCVLCVRWLESEMPGDHFRRSRNSLSITEGGTMPDAQMAAKV